MANEIKAPTNRLIGLINSLLDNLINGFGAEIAIKLAIAQEPWLTLPVIHWIFTTTVKAVASKFEIETAEIADKFIIRVQGNSLKESHDEIIAKFKSEIGNPAITEEERAKTLAAAKASIDALVNRNR